MQLWATAKEDLELTFREFWKLTPKMFSALVRRHRLQQEREDYRFGVMAATFSNSAAIILRSLAGAKDKFEPVHPENFFYMPLLARHKATNKDSPKEERQTWQQQLAIISMLNAALGGEVKAKEKAQ